MSSNIDPTKPTTGTATTESVRDNFGYAKTEIEALQADVATAQATADSAVLTAMQTLYPVGALYLSTLATNPNTLLGFGTWAAFGAGRVMVSQDAGQTEFDTLEETGGEKTHTLTTTEIPSHTHTQNAHTHTQDAHTHTQNSHLHGKGAPVNVGSASGAQSLYVGTGNGSSTTDAATATNQNATATNQNTTATNNNTGGDGAHNNLQPYIVIKAWKRTA